jgi:hypothetical protein
MSGIAYERPFFRFSGFFRQGIVGVGEQTQASYRSRVRQEYHVSPGIFGGRD